jgi:hypothetical protein
MANLKEYLVRPDPTSEVLSLRRSSSRANSRTSVLVVLEVFL